MDACVGDRSVEGCMLPLGRARSVTDMSFLFQAAQFNVDISQWEMSQVTDCARYVRGRLRASTRTSRVDLRRERDTTGMFTGADTWLSVSRDGWF